MLFVAVLLTKEEQWSIPTIAVPTANRTRLDYEWGGYYGQPDMTRLQDDKTAITLYPKGHGIGAVIMQRTEDAGLTWSGHMETPTSWVDSQETPTIYDLVFTNGTELLIHISGGPGWGSGFKGWHTSLSRDKGMTWSEYYVRRNGTESIVAMASLVQVKENGKFVDKWMGVFHNYAMQNQRTYLTFDADGNDVWSEPYYLIPQWRDVEYANNLCELLVFRPPEDENALVLVARANTNKVKSYVAFSHDEGITWTKPHPGPGALAGHRHKLAIDPITKRLVISYREVIVPDITKDWCAWVGTYSDLVLGREGQYRITLAEDYNPSWGDNGYAGAVAFSNGVLLFDSYGVFEKGGPSFIQADRFKLAELDNLLNLIDRSGVEQLRTAAIERGNIQLAYECEVVISRRDLAQIEIDDFVREAASRLY